MSRRYPREIYKKWKALPEVAREPIDLLVRRYSTYEMWRKAEPSARFFMFDPCVYCGHASDTWDHLDARVKGGRDASGNAARACGPCNKQKASLSVLHYLAYKALGRPDEYRVSVGKSYKYRGILYQLERLLIAREKHR